LSCSLITPLFVHTRERPSDSSDYYFYKDLKDGGAEYWIRYGGYSYDGFRYYWRDTLQLDISNPSTLAVLLTQLKRAIVNFGVDAFRVDMAYQLQNHRIEKLWGTELGFPLGVNLEDEFLFQLIYNIKKDYPHISFIAEGFDSFDLLSEIGFDLVYSKNEMTLTGGVYHEGWYNALESRSGSRILAAIERAAFLIWQKGGTGMLAFVGHHDLPAPDDVFGDWVWGATVLTLLLPASILWYNGTEVGFKATCSDNQKMITFNKPVNISWDNLGGDWYEFVRKILLFRSELTATLSNHSFNKCKIAYICDNELNPKVIGYTISEEEKPKAIILANLSGKKDVIININGQENTYSVDEVGPRGWLVSLL
jgi:hypothetical protein